MPDIILKNVSKKFKDSAAVDCLNLEIKDGSYVTLLGPSGCGKTTTLRMIAGLETPTQGEIWIGDKLVFSSEKGIDITPDKRNIGFLFQNYALWPHMTVYKNIAFGLENLKWSKQDIGTRVKELLGTLQIEEFAERYPSELSGGQQQRVAIARTLATNPSILLMDEPLSNLDAKLRLDMRAELKRLHMDTKSTFVYVTHDQQEAMALSTEICLIKKGLLQQYCKPLDLYSNPVNKFVADFMGSPTINFIDFICKSEGNALTLKNDDFNLKFIPDSSVKMQQFEKTTKVTLGVRPEYILIEEGGNIEASVYSSLPSGMETMVILEVGGQRLNAVVFGSKDYQIGSKLMISISGSKNLLFDSETKNKIGLGSIEVLK